MALYGDNKVVVMEAATGKVLRECGVPGVFRVAFTPDGRHVITGNNDCTVWVLRLADPPK